MKKAPRTIPLEDTSSPPQIDQRRLFMRQQPRTLVYVEMDGGNGGIALNISEDGFCVQAVVALMEDALPHVRFQLPGHSEWIETSAHIIWANESRKLIGARFVELSQDARQMIRDWLKEESQTPAVPSVMDSFPSSNGESVRARPSDRARFGRRSVPPNVSQLAPPSEALPAIGSLPESAGRSAQSLSTRPPLDRQPIQPVRQHPITPEPFVAQAAVSPPESPARPSSPSSIPAQPNRQPGPAFEPPQAAPVPAAPARPTLPPTHEEVPFRGFSSVSSAERFQAPGDRQAGLSGLIVFFVFLGAVCIAAGWAMGAGDIAGPGFLQGFFGSVSALRGVAGGSGSQPEPPAQVSEIAVVPTNGPAWKIPVAPDTSAQVAESRPGSTAPERATNDADGGSSDTNSPASPDAPTSGPAPETAQASGDLKQAAQPTVTSPSSSPAAHVFPRYENKPPASTDAELVYRVDPIYPTDAIRQHISGVVKLRLTVEPDGTVGQVFLVSGPPLLVDAAINAARRWRYVPATENNAAKESSVDIGLVFQLP